MFIIRSCILALLATFTLAACSTYQSTQINSTSHKANIDQIAKTVTGQVTTVFMQLKGLISW